MTLPLHGLDEDDEAPLPRIMGAGFDRGLEADAEALARVRARVTAEFRRRSTAGSTSVAAGRVSVPRPRRWPGALRPLAPLGVAGALVLGSVGLVAANSSPGDAFYEWRLIAEEFSPLGAATHLDRLQQRLDEATHEPDNPSAVSAALQAYREELQRALDEATDDAGRQAILDALKVHRVVLESLLQTVPAAATGGLEQALSQVGKADREVKAKNSSAPHASATPKKSTPDRTDRPDPSRRPNR